MAEKIIAENRKAFHDYFIEDKVVAGIVLEGSEVKSARAGKFHLKDSYCLVRNGEVFLINANISTYDKTSVLAPDPKRTRKLLLNRAEINKIERKIKIKGYALIPLKAELRGQFVKVEIALCRGKMEYDKKDAIQLKDAKRDTEREIKSLKN